MQSFQLAEIERELAASGKAWKEFLRPASMSMGIYRIPAGGVDAQQPHTEDEVYYVIRGRAAFQCDGKMHAVNAGSILFVEKNVEHRFVDIVEDLTVLVFFAPPEYSLKGQ